MSCMAGVHEVLVTTDNDGPGFNSLISKVLPEKLMFWWYRAFHRLVFLKMELVNYQFTTLQ